MGFVDLHTHSEYSLLDGAGSPLEKVKKAKALGREYASISDHGSLMGAPHHIEACHDQGLTPIVGVEAYFKPDRHKKDVHNKKAWHVLLIAKNENGFKNLIKLTTEANLTGFYHKPCIDYELLEKWGDDIFCNSACVTGYLPWLIQHEPDEHAARECIEKHLSIFGDDYRFSIMPHDSPSQFLVNTKLANYSMEYGIPLVAEADSHYTDPEWQDTQDVLLMIATNQSRKRRVAKREEGEDVYQIDVPLHMFTEEEMYENFARKHSALTQKMVTDAMEETEVMAKQIEPFELDTSDKLPKIMSPEKERDTIWNWCLEGLKRIGKEDDPVYRERLEFEFETIKDMGVVGYFVIVGRIVRWARDQGIRISSGRGSAAGSLICYLIKITTLDPIAHGLLFERFLNPNRKGMPDIDIDFQDDRRDEVIERMKLELGEDHVARLLALGTFGAKSALKSVARVLDVPFHIANQVSSVIPEAKDVGGAGNVPPLATCREMYAEIDKFAKEYPEVWKHALRIEGMTSGLSQHAAGVIVSDKPITDHMPLLKGKQGIVTAWSDSAKHPWISKLGLLKFDILSLEGLSRQGKAVEIIEEYYGDKIDLDDLEVARDPEAADPEVMKLFRRGQTLGISQFGGSKQIANFLKHTKPDEFKDLVAVNALYRPGALEGGDAFKYGDLKSGKLPVTYWHPLVEPILKETYGIMVYQEQMQKIAQVLGQFSPGDSDDMRKATSKLYRLGKLEAREFMADYKERWDAGTSANGLSQKESDYIWERMLAFGAYSFNKSHAASYSLNGYQDGWIKKNYPLAFYAPLLTNKDNISDVIREARTQDILVTPPDINESDSSFTVVGDKLLYGLESVKYVGNSAVKEIQRARPFESIEEIREKTESRSVDKRVIEFLEMSGALDSLGGREGKSIEERRELEIEALGVPLSGVGDSAKYEKIIEARIHTEDDVEDAIEGQLVVIAGEISGMKEHKIKSGRNKGKPMGYVDLSYKDNSWNVTVFNDKYEQYKELLAPGKVVMLRGKKDSRGSIIANTVIEVAKLVKALEKGD